MIKNNKKSVLMLGIGGISMYQLALAYQKLGYCVYGYDAKESKYTKICNSSGIKTTKKLKKQFLNVDLCVKTPAIKQDNNYLQLLKCPIIDRATALNGLFKYFKCVIAVAGTHGKSTTSSLIYHILKRANKKVSCHIGADVSDFRFNLGDEYLVVEACEYNKSFLQLYPNIAVVTNVEAEHMDCYKNLFDLQTSFLKFIKRGSMRFCYNEKSTKFFKKIKDINICDCDNVVYKSKLKGEHNQKNIALATKVCECLNINKNIINQAVAEFEGVPRRYQHIGNVGKTKICIDYAHHPTEIQSFITTFSKEYENCLIVFQPHTYSRTKMFFNDFLRVLKPINNLVIYKEYPARESANLGKSAYELYLELSKINSNVKYCSNYKNLSKNIQNYEAVAFVGAGDINVVAEKIKEMKK